MDIPAEVDIAILGGGLAGHAAALEAAEHGAKVLLVEKTEHVGGSTLQSSGSFAFAGTKAQEEAGFRDSSEQMFEDIVKASGGLADSHLVELFVEHQADAYLWLIEHDVKFHPVTLSSNQGVPRTHATAPRQLMDVLHEAVRAHPNIFFVDRTASSLRTDEAGRVVGVQTQRHGHVLSVAARRGVVLATGGFSRSAELIGKFAPRMGTAMRLGGEGNTGDGLLMAWKLGADVVDMAHISGTFGISLNRYPCAMTSTAKDAMLRLAIYRGAIAVNLLGQRFADESISYKVLGELCLAQPEGIGFQIWDESIMEQSVSAPNASDLKSAYGSGLVRRANDIAGLAVQVGIDAQRLVDTVDAYNVDVQAGRDRAFGRTSLGKGWGALVPISRSPFYIYPCTTAVLATYCGLRVDKRMRVIDVFKRPIEGLYAAGEIVGGFHGSGYMSGSSLTKSVIFGRRAACSALGGESVDE